MRLMMDLVVNHTSDEHRWFVESRSSRDNPYRDYYIWHPGKDGREPNDWASFFSGSAWKKDEITGEYYLHLFAEKQPDLNWDNPAVRREVHDIMRFWLDKGVDGFRMDVIPFISKDQAFPDYPERHRTRPQYAHADGPRLHDYLREMNREVLRHYDVTTVGEAFGVTLEQTPLLVDERRGELDMILHFDAVRVDRGEGWRWKPWALPDLKAIYARHHRALDVHCWHTVFLSNHDNPRPVSHFGDDEEPYRVPSAKLLATMLLTLKGAPFVYQGDELGMTNHPFTDIGQFDDIEVRNAWRAEVLTGRVSAAEFMANMLKVSRDHARTPMQWDDGPNAGFTTSRPWFAVNPNADRINAKQALADPASVYHHYARLIALRRDALSLVYGDYEDLDPDHPTVFAYTRTLASEAHLIVLNFSREVVPYRLPDGLEAGRLLLSNLDGAESSGTTVTLRPWEARIYRS
jgi:oligo-1,6-glucosidase